MPVAMPDEGRLPPGPLRALTQAIYALYVSAGMPATRTISDAIRDRDELRDTVSHEAVRNILQGTHARWSKIECLVIQLATWSVIDPNPKAELRRIHKLWSAAEQTMDSAQIQQDGDGKDQEFLNPRISISGQGLASPANDGPGSGNQPETLLTTTQPLITWTTRIGTLDVYDRQMAIQIIKDMGDLNG